ncbi:aldehyde dehydrogenase family protein [Chromohalobacter japonicus]|uniref:aldehyde dehydrogenase family protein n=1 Tax=Chromohalobacter japonicus TaxID=223900 RepID=UPI0009E65BC8|nr:aldehyde dehydrogenase family protein [Chromohalobacter japonicus]
MEVSDLQRARERIAEALAPTPLLLDQTLSERLERRVWLKAESFQHTGSFKTRGALNWLRTASDEELAGGLGAVSAGNHALGLAWAARQMGISVTIVIPSNVPDSLAMGVRVPCGVVVGIAPWNAPIILGTRAIATPLACGNTVILKASEQCPATHHLIGEVLVEAGLGDGIVNVVTNAPPQAAEVVEALIEHPAVRRINFTGSTNVGRIIAEKAAHHLKPVLLELGGKAPFVVLEDADLDAAVEAAAFGAFFNQGQICMSTERLIVVDAVADAFVEKLARKAETLRAGDPREDGNPLGTLINREAGEKLNGLLDDAQQHGARLACGGKAEGVIMQPTVVDGVTPAMRLYGEESFGPVVAMMRVKDEEDALRVANDSEYGLSAAVFSRDTARAMRVAQRVESGICHINGPTVHDEPQMPFGGVKSSGYGRFGGKAGIEEFTELRWMTMQLGPRHYPI